MGDLAELHADVARANRILAHEGVLDVFGHVSVRDPRDPGRYLLSRSRSPELVEAGDILEFTLDSAPVRPTDIRLYAERVIHGEIYEARPDVHAVVHHHAPAVLPFCVTGAAIVPVFHVGAALGAKIPFWDGRDEFGDTNMLVAKPEEGASLARALGPHWVVLMRRHGATVAGASLREVTFRTIQLSRNAEIQLRALALGTIEPLSPREIELAGRFNLSEPVLGRAWEYWTRRLEKAESSAPKKRASRPARPGRRRKR